MSVSSDYYREQLHNKRAVSIGFLKKFARSIDVDIFDKIYSRQTLFFTAKKRRVRLPKEVSNDLAYFYGYLQGDGCLTLDKKGVVFSDEYLEQMERINELSGKLFGFHGKIYPKMSKISLKPSYQIEIKSVVLNSFFYHVMGINRGIKKNLKITELLMHDDIILKSYFSGLFDVDGTLPKNPEKAKQLFIDLTMKDEKFIHSIENFD